VNPLSIFCWCAKSSFSAILFLHLSPLILLQ
jgi:hypothetical protein